ncbi:IclR family transcriptional regulator [Aquibaculum arenosum]|uniref:IclR family transcriptional regulator n=1 Tax=Aquibaculum arenosum TaxID=3032591 RepID=A0ABT5YI19_9PROT|nr:IclR family transcriptional regulator [Fodinicurvata sp. CAU 1616]MDF2094553.1 IclR family transcriptional regulator [Fodinicurvata sp. CAU 1616]
MEVFEGSGKGQARGARRGIAVQGAAAFSKYMAVLQAVADEPGRLDRAGLARQMPYPRGTVYRLVSALEAENLLNEHADGTLHLGHRLISLASRSWENSDLRSTAHDHLEELRRLTGETVHLAVPSGLGMVYIDKLESPHTVRMTSRIGTYVDLHTTSVGKAYLAALSPDARAALVQRIEFRPRTSNSITDAPTLLQEVERVAQQGYSEDREEQEPEIRCFGAAILDRDGAPVGCVSVSVPTFRFDAQTAKAQIGHLKRAVARISAEYATLV